MTRSSASEVITAWTPRSVPSEAADFARRVVTAVGPQSRSRAKALLFAAAKLAAFGLVIGLEPDEEVLFRASVIERFASSEHAGAGPTSRTLRTNLRFLARTLLGDTTPGAPVLPRERAKPPYRPAEVAAYLALCDAQPTALRRARATALVCLGAGAGLIGGELRRVRGEDVLCRSGGVLVSVSGERARTVPVLAPYHDRLLAAASFFGPRYLVAGTNPDSHNVTNPLLRSLSGGSDLARLEPARLRSTYLVTLAETIGLKAFMEAAGVRCSQRLGDLVAELESPTEAEAVARLGATRR